MLYPVLGDVVRTMLKVNGQSPNEFLASFISDRHEMDMSMEDYCSILQSERKSLPKTFVAFLSDKLGYSQRYWSCLNKALCAADVSVYDVLGADIVVDLGTVPMFNKRNNTADADSIKWEIDTPISSKSVLGLFLVSGRKFRPQITLEDGRSIRLQFTTYTQDRIRVAWALARKYATQENKNDPTEITAGDLLYDPTNVLFNSYNYGDCAELAMHVEDVNSEKIASDIPLFSSVCATKEGTALQACWNDNIKHIWSTEYELCTMEDCPIDWERYQ